MNETLKRGISGAVYIVLLLASILFSTESFFILFGIFLVIAVYEFCNLIQISKVVPILFAVVFYTAVTLLSFYKNDFELYLSETFHSMISFSYDTTKVNVILLVITLVVSTKCILFFRFLS